MIPIGIVGVFFKDEVEAIFVKARFSSPSIPNNAEPMARCPLLLTGRYSVSP